MAYHPHEKLKQNLTAIRIALGFQQGDRLTDTQRWALSSYAGFGGVKAILFPEGSKENWEHYHASEADLRLYGPITELHTLLKEYLDHQSYTRAIDSLRNSVLTAYYTPELIPDVLYRALRENNIRPKHLYEPSAGAGIFITKAQNEFPTLEKITAAEKDILSGKVLTARVDGSTVPVTVHCMGLEETPIHESGKADMVVSNIPFGDYRVFEDELQQMKAQLKMLDQQIQDKIKKDLENATGGERLSPKGSVSVGTDGRL